MTDLSRLKVSLTKHNAHKIARLLKDYRADQILEKLHEVHAEEAQAYKNLSVLPDNKIPEVWSKVKKLGDNAIDALVFVSIIFSHHKLIDAMISASSRSGFSGRIERGVQIKAKEYTNFARVIDQLGFATKLDYPGVTFNLRSMFEIPGLGPLVGELLEHKLVAARWNRFGSVSDEAVAQNFHQVFGLSASEFKDWLSTDVQPKTAGTSLLPKDEEFFQGEGEGGALKEFEFRAGHTERAVEPISKAASAKTKVNQLHNDIQNKLFSYLCAQYGEKCVGTELDTGSGTSIDVVVKEEGKTTFYEIKTSASVRTNIRQAIPQLLEYAYWSERKSADELVIVSPLPITKSAARYLKFLRKEFKLPLSYRQFDIKTNELI
ncbi:hypothetical protein [Pseudomonas sp. JG-B]|uniref:hypothetical protein n=1 Tax=Pseudomonas sp. JG-B TaxID=2603214 RepID=UPI00129E0E74|nr:hypothetical protein [Pseudomonas sp. JG-B]MRK21527.1 hypothetical protein [Pseudomonas sp. JG-B]